MIIVSNVKAVDKAFLSIDQDRTVCKTIEHIVTAHHDEYEFSFANGGDQNNQSIPRGSGLRKAQRSPYRWAG